MQIFYYLMILLVTKKFFQIVSYYGHPEALADNQKLQPGCLWDNHLLFLNLDTAARNVNALSRVAFGHYRYILQNRKKIQKTKPINSSPDNFAEMCQGSTIS